MLPDRLRTGRRVGRTIYDGDELVGVMDTRELAAAVVDAFNREPLSSAQIDLVFLLLSARPVEVDVSVEQANELARTLRGMHAERRDELTTTEEGWGVTTNEPATGRHFGGVTIDSALIADWRPSYLYGREVDVELAGRHVALEGQSAVELATWLLMVFEPDLVQAVVDQMADPEGCTFTEALRSILVDQGNLDAREVPNG